MNDSEREFKAGLKNIEQRLIDEARGAGVALTSDNIFWNRHGDGGIPEATTLEIKHQGSTANFVLSREQIEDSWERIERADVLAVIRQCITSLTRR